MNILAWILCASGLIVATGLWFVGEQQRQDAATRWTAQSAALTRDNQAAIDDQAKAAAGFTKRLAELDAEIATRTTRLEELRRARADVALPVVDGATLTPEPALVAVPAPGTTVQPLPPVASAGKLPVSMRVPYGTFLRYQLGAAMKEDLRSGMSPEAARLDEFIATCKLRAVAGEQDADLAKDATKLAGYVKTLNAERQKISAKWEAAATGAVDDKPASDSDSADSVDRQRKNLEADWRRFLDDARPRVMPLAKSVFQADDALSAILDAPGAYGAFSSHPERQRLLKAIAAIDASRAEIDGQTKVIVDRAKAADAAKRKATDK